MGPPVRLCRRPKDVLVTVVDHYEGIPGVCRAEDGDTHDVGFGDNLLGVSRVRMNRRGWSTRH